ncbi:MAG: PD-(D/E)XK nuclease family protein, partial [Chloroflexota bacterium]
RARIFPNDFAAAVQGRGPRLEEIALVYTSYQDWLQRENWADNEGRGWLAAIALEENPSLGADTRLLVVTGFDEFNPTQLSVLSLLARRARETLITLTGDLQRPPRPAQHRFHRAQAAIQSSLGVESKPLDSVSLLSPAIAHVENYLFENPQSESVIASPDGRVGGALPPYRDRGAKQSPPMTRGLLRREEHPPRNDGAEIEFIEAQTRATEARAALRWVKACLVRDSLALSDVTVLARDLEPYRPFLEETAAEFGIPLRMVGGQPLNENPAIAALLSLLSLPVEDWPRRPLLDAWRSPYFDWSEQGITPAEAALLDEISRFGRVTGGLSQWREAFDLWEKRQVIPDKEEDGDSPLPMGEGSGVMSAFESFIDCITPPTHATVRQYVAFIENLMGDDPALLPSHPPYIPPFSPRSAPATAERDVAALRTFKDVLRGLVLAEAALGTDSRSYADFFADLRGAVETATYSVAPSAGVLTASVLDARGLSFEAVVLMGMSEGEFPRQEREDILLRESDRATLREHGLPLETRLHGDEGTFFYQAVTRARRKLLLTRPYLTEDGQLWEASPFWEEIRRLSGNRPTVRVRPEDGLDPAEAASQVEWLEAVQEFDIHMQRGVEALNARLNRRAAGTFEGETPELAEDLSARFGPSHGWSASRLESYGTCPFEFFIAHALELKPRTPPEEGYDVRMLGSMLHKILEDVYRSAASLDDCLEILPEKAGAVFATAPQVYGFRPTPLWDLQQQELERRLRETITALAEVSQGYAPRHFETRFGMGEPSLVLKTEAGEVRLHGYIDRLDAAPDGSLRVIDYKSGGAAISAGHLKEGRRLQLPIYALAARDALGLGEISGGFYWHIQQAKPSSLKLEKYEGGAQAAFDTAVSHIGNHVTRIRAGHFEPKPPAEGCPSYCPAVGFCWRYKKGY